MAAVNGNSHESNSDGDISSSTANDKAEIISKAWGFPIEELFKLALKFYKEKVGTKALELTYQDKMKLVALSKQVAFGPYKVDINPQVGFLDVIGNDRRQAWRALGDMSQQTAMLEFVQTLTRLSSLLKPYVEAYRMEKEETERQLREQQLRAVQEAEDRERLAREEVARRYQEMEQERQQQQEMLIRAALNQQTASQFQQYAQQQYPNMVDKQNALIQQLQEQHYKQYMEQVYQQQRLHQQEQQEQIRRLQQQQQQVQHEQHPSAVETLPQQPTDAAHDTVKTTAADPIPASAINREAAKNVEAVSSPAAKVKDTKKVEFATSPKVNGGPHVEGVAREGEEDAEAAENRVEGEDGLPAVAAASMWTRKDIKELKGVLSKDADSVIQVGSGETVTIRVPTHEDGSCLFWEFATDGYDISFGVSFEWSLVPGNQVSVHVCESSEEEEEEDEGQGSPATGGERADHHHGEEQRKASTLQRKKKSDKSQPPTDEIVALFRRDSHQEVHCGSHVYPGRGVYLLKFDNSYSLWRGKTLYYRVYYTR